MKNLEDALRLEKESYENVQVPQQLTRKVGSILDNLPPQRKSCSLWTRKLVAAAAVLLIISSMLYHQVPSKMRSMLKEAFNSIPKRGTEKDIKKGALPVKENQYHPVVLAFKDPEGQFSRVVVLGGSKDGKWYSINDFKMAGKYIAFADFPYNEGQDFRNYVDLDLVKGNEVYNFYARRKLAGKSKGEKPILSVPQSAPKKILEVKIDTLKADDDFLIGINGGWNGLPRVPTFFSGLNGCTVDLESDGIEETVYSQIISGNLKVFLEKNGGGILIKEVPKELVDVMQTPKIRVLDINGDGKLEIIIVLKNSYETTVEAYQYVNNTLEKVLSYYVGE